MYQCVLPSTSSVHIGYDGSLRQNTMKRLASDDISVSPKRRRYYYRLESESSIASEDESTESIYSHQDYETELVMDTPDTESKSEYSDDSEVDLEIEYEVESSSEGEENPLHIESSTGAEDFLAVAGAMAAVICEPSLEPSLTDGEDSDNSSTPEVEVSRKDYDRCIQCKLQNDNPLFRYCKKCFQVRKSFFPPRPRAFKKKDRKSKDNLILKQSIPNSLTNSPDLTKEDSNALTSSSSSLGSSIVEKVSNLEEKETSSISSSTAYKERCIMCHVEPKNSIFVHGHTAHMCCCHKCALKSWRRLKKCPVCNRTASNVVRVFVT